MFLSLLTLGRRAALLSSATLLLCACSSTPQPTTGTAVAALQPTTGNAVMQAHVWHAPAYKLLS